MTADWLLMFARGLALGARLGRLIVLDCVETPARHRLAATNRNQVVAAGREVAAAFHRAEAVVGGTLLAAGALLAGGTATAAHGSLAAVICFAVMWLPPSPDASGRGPARPR